MVFFRALASPEAAPQYHGITLLQFFNNGNGVRRKTKEQVAKSKARYNNLNFATCSLLFVI